jgi:DNA-binding transcriptional LysR family regulator
MDHDFGDIRAFLQVVDSGGVSAAATHLSISKSALSARVARLEEALKAKLLHRSPRGVLLTDVGQRFYDRMCDVRSRLQEAADEIAGDDDTRLSGSLRLTAPMTFGTTYLAPLLFRFMEQHPQLTVTLELDDRYVDILSGGYDLALRIGRLEDSSLMARRIARSARVLCCSPSYAERRRVPSSIAELADHPCICYGSASVAPYWQFAATEPDGPPQLVVVRGRTHLNNGESMRDAAIAGLGFAVLPLFIAAPALRDSQLIAVLPQTPPLADTIHAVYPQTRYVSRAVRVLIDALVDNFKGVPPWERIVPVHAEA